MRHEVYAIIIALFQSINNIRFKFLIQSKCSSWIDKAIKDNIIILPIPLNQSMQVPAKKKKKNDNAELVWQPNENNE